MPILIRLLAITVLLFSPMGLPAPALSPQEVPEPLKPWVDWVLQDPPQTVCPFLYHNPAEARCSWPSRLNLDLQNTKGRFTLGWQVYRDDWISLPGDNEHWPQNVSANNKALAVMDRNGSPAVKLKAGIYQISGEFLWDSLPDNLQIPGDAGLIDVRVNGAALVLPAIKNGQLWLKQSEAGLNKAEDSQNNLDIQVFRKISDGVPMQILTRIELDVSGQQREARLNQPLLAGFIPLSLSSPLPARLEADGQLLLQLRPGHWQLELLARHVAEINELNLDNRSQDWPDSEIWVFESQPNLRMVEIEQPAGIDAGQTNLPADWKSLPAYKITQGQSMRLKIIRRGDPEPEPNQLSLNRQLWLDFAGRGYTVKDHIGGQMSRDWRLNALPETRLGRVVLDGNDQLITRQGGSETDPEKQGVEVRKGQIDLQADSRVETGPSRISAAGWRQNFYSVRAELNLPPGWRLLAAGGVDNVPDSWVSRWTLLDLFMVLIASLATSRLWSVGWGVFALMTLALIWHEPQSPHFVWLNILAATALLKVLPENRFFKLLDSYRRLCWLSLILITVPFMAMQVRFGLYPQLEQADQPIMQQPYGETQGLTGSVDGGNIIRDEANLPASAPVRMFKKTTQPPAMMSYNMAERSDVSANLERIDPKARVQTGPGLPQWQWQKILLNWNGSVDAEQQLHLWLLSPGWHLVLNCLRTVLVFIMALLMFGLADKLKFKLKPAAPLMLCLLCLPLLLFCSPDSQADYPDQALLDALKNKLRPAPEAPDCAPACAQIPQMRLEINAQQLDINLQIHAQELIALPLPADSRQWFPLLVLVDGLNAQGLYRDEQGLWLKLEAGAHQVKLSGPITRLNKFTLPLPLKPRHVTIDSPFWDVQGLHENGQSDEQLQFSRKPSAATGSNTSSLDAAAAPQLPAFAQIVRTLQLGLDWRVTTQVIRLSPGDAAIVLSVPLLPGEAVLTPGVRTKSGHAEVSIPPGQTAFQWQSSLEKAASIQLQAPQTSEWIEVWQADISPIWHPETSGIPIMHQDHSGRWLPEWHPWPGEQLLLNLSRPESIGGQTLTIDSSQLSVTPGQRSQSAQLNFSLRSSLGGQQTLTLPAQAVLQSVAINGRNQPIRQEGQKLILPINPGKQEISLTWQQAAGISWLFDTPQVDLGAASVNSRLQASLGQDRWVLFCLGPSFGPAVLFWGILLVLAILAAALSKVPLTPLRYRHWFLLLLGLSQISIEAGGLVIGWLMLLGWRKQANNCVQAQWFNWLQAAIALLTLVSIGLLFLAVEQGLLGSPQMQIAGNQSSAFNLNWYQDRSGSILPIATVISAPLFVYRILMLAWSLWLAVSLLDWLKWGWQCFSAGALWITAEKPAKEKPQAEQWSEPDKPL